MLDTSLHANSVAEAPDMVEPQLAPAWDQSWQDHPSSMTSATLAAGCCHNQLELKGQLGWLMWWVTCVRYTLHWMSISWVLQRMHTEPPSHVPPDWDYYLLRCCYAVGGGVMPCHEVFWSKQWTVVKEMLLLLYVHVYICLLAKPGPELPHAELFSWCQHTPFISAG